MIVSADLQSFARLQAEATLLLSRHGEILFANDAAREVLGVGSEDVALSAFVTDPPETFDAYLRMWARSSESLPAALHIKRKGEDEAVGYRCRGGLVTSNGDRDETILFCRLEAPTASNPFTLLSKTVAELSAEVARRQKAEQALRQSEAQLRERAIDAETTNRIKDEFLAALSHELRTPLNAILGWTILLRNGLADDKREHAIETIERNTRAQAKLIEDLLELSRIVTGKLSLKSEPTELRRAVEQAIETVRPTADAKGVELRTRLDVDAGLVMGDSDRLHQLVCNILANAVKFTPRGGSVTVGLSRTGTNVEVTVTDTGKGVTSDFLPHVFDRFRQAESSTTRSHGGLGLGLAIAKSIVEAHGGTIHASSQGDGKGATFTICIPHAPLGTDERQEPAGGQLHAMARVAALRGLRIVVVDDEADGRQLLSMIFEQAGATVALASNAADALELVKTSQPDVLVSDIGMPDEDGYTLVRKLRALGADDGGRTPAIAVTAYARAEDRRKALSAGFRAHVTKPINPGDVVATVAAAVSGRK